MEPTTPSTSRRRSTERVLLAASLAALMAALFFFAPKLGLREAAESAILSLRGLGPGVFFVAMAVLPAVGFPMIAFTLAAGPVFAPALGAGSVIAWSLTAVVGNLLLTYWLADRALRPLVSGLLHHFEFRLPESVADGAWQTTLIVRLTPGPPFWLQSYLLGLIRVPLGPYLVVSTLVMAGYIVALVVGGDAITQGNGRLAFAAIGGLVVLVAVLQLVRKHTTRRRAAANHRLAAPILPANASVR
jgi:uncharacterized membrane protein YdjX (TVP38/TMEM64 family)